MHVNSGHVQSNGFPFGDKSYALVVESCGTYKLIRRPTLLPTRPKVTSVYHLLYIASGKARFYFHADDDMETVVSAGNMVLFRPQEYEHYVCNGQDHSEIFWVHFSGTDVKSFLQHHGICKEQRIINTGTSPEFKRLFRQMIVDTQRKKPLYEESIALTLEYLFVLIHREMIEQSDSIDTVHDEIIQAFHYFADNYNRDICIEEYAEEHHMSTAWFIKRFKQYTKMTPKEYIVSVRMSHAQTLLEQTLYTISEIASIVGYDNPLYFSRVFKKQFGLPPNQYRAAFIAREKGDSRIDSIP